LKEGIWEMNYNNKNNETKAINKTINKQYMIVGLIILALLIISVILAVFNKINTEKMLEGRDTEFFELTIYDDSYKIDMALINEIGLKEIKANYKKSGMPVEETTFSGVSFKSILETLEADYSEANSVAFHASDGYASAITIDEATDPGQTWIVVKQEGELLGEKAVGGNGPFMMILAKDNFSQRWVKFLIKVEIN